MRARILMLGITLVALESCGAEPDSESHVSSNLEQIARGDRQEFRWTAPFPSSYSDGIAEVNRGSSRWLTYSGATERPGCLVYGPYHDFDISGEYSFYIEIEADFLKQDLIRRRRTGPIYNPRYVNDNHGPIVSEFRVDAVRQEAGKIITIASRKITTTDRIPRQKIGIGTVSNLDSPKKVEIRICHVRGTHVEKFTVYSQSVHVTRAM